MLDRNVFQFSVSSSVIEKPKAPAVEGLFTMNEVEPALLGSCCGACGAFFFPKEEKFCRNPVCRRSSLSEVTLSRRGFLWSYTSASYKPPPPFVAQDPFEPFAIAAVNLQIEGLTVLGQVADRIRTDELEIGMMMELVLRELYEDDEYRYLTWNWLPVSEQVRRGHE